MILNSNKNSKKQVTLTKNIKQQFNVNEKPALTSSSLLSSLTLNVIEFY